MEKMNMIWLIFAMVFLMCSCSFTQEDERMRVAKNVEARAEARMEEVIHAIEDRDVSALRGLFSRMSLKKSDDFDSTAEQLFELIQGDVKSWEQYKFTSGSSIDHGKESSYIQCWYTIVSTKSTYKCYIYDYYIDTINSDNEGIYTLRFWDSKVNISDWEDIYHPGIMSYDKPKTLEQIYEKE